MTGITRAAKTVSRARVHRLAMGLLANRGSIATRIFAPGGAIRIITALMGQRLLHRQFGCRNPNQFGLQNSDARRSTRGRTSPMSFLIPNRRKMRRHISRTVHAPISVWTGSCAHISSTGRETIRFQLSMAGPCWTWIAFICGPGIRDRFRSFH
ncbi:hypothetical protein FQZ97_889780 [compost metagenome]